MRREQLRVGNWILDDGKFVQVDGIQASGRIVVYDKEYDDFKRGIDPDPIPLNTELLLKCGFVKHQLGYYHANLFFIYLPGSPSSDFGFGIVGIGIIRSVKYLHDLQNLCFILSDEELEIKLV